MTVPLLLALACAPLPERGSGAPDFGEGVAGDSGDRDSDGDSDGDSDAIDSGRTYVETEDSGVDSLLDAGPAMRAARASSASSTTRTEPFLASARGFTGGLWSRTWMGMVFKKY